MSLTSAFTFATISSASLVCSQPVPGSVGCQQSEWHRRLNGHRCRSERQHESPTVIEDHQPRVPQTGLLDAFGSEFEHLPEAAKTRARLLLVTRLDGEVRAHLRDEAVAIAHARLLGNLAFRFSCNCPIRFLTGPRRSPLILSLEFI